VEVVPRRDLFDRPAKVSHGERRRPTDRGQLVVLQEHDPSLSHEAPGVEQGDEHPIESVAAIDERKIEAAAIVE
jgi:hypothetical protein